MWDQRFPSLSRVHLKKRAEEEGVKSVGSFPYQRLITKPKFLVVIGKLDKLLPCQQILVSVGRRQHCWPTTRSIFGCYLLRPVEKSTIKTRTLSQRKDSKHMFVSHCHVFMSINNKKTGSGGTCPCAHPVACCCLLLRVVGNCCARF